MWPHTHTHTDILVELNRSKSIGGLTLQGFSDSTYSIFSVKEEMQMSRVQPITIKVLQEKNRRTGLAAGEGGRNTKTAEERAAERLTMGDRNKEPLFGCWGERALDSHEKSNTCYFLGLHQEKGSRKQLTRVTGQEQKVLFMIRCCFCRGKKAIKPNSIRLISVT